MLTFSQSLQIAALVLGAVMLLLGFGFWAGHKSAHSRPRLGGFLGFLAILGFAFGPLGVLTATVKWSMPVCLAAASGWLLVSGVAWGVVMSNYGKGLRRSRNVSFLQGMYLVGAGVVVTGLVFSHLVFEQPAVAEDAQIWGRQIGVFSITSMVYFAFGSLVYWMYRWSRSGLAQAVPLNAEEQFLDSAQPTPGQVAVAPVAKKDDAPVSKDTATGPAPVKSVPTNADLTAAKQPVVPLAADPAPGDLPAAGQTVNAPEVAEQPAVGGEDVPRTKLILRNGEGTLSD